MQIEITRYHCAHTAMAPPRETTGTCGDRLGKARPAAGNVRGAVALEHGLAVAYKIKARPHDSTLRCLSETRPHRILYVNDHSRTPQESLQVATTHISIS